MSTEHSDLRPRLPSQLKEGKIIPPTNLELIVADHCNITCRQCNHASPVMRKWNATPEDVARDLNRLAPIYRPQILRMLGGEPLLNPQLTEIIKAARASGITEHIQLVTNGMLLERLEDAAWEMLSEVEISIYPGAGITPKLLETMRIKGIRYGTQVTTAKFPTFRQTYAKQRSMDRSLIEQIWRGCKIAQIWGCHTVREGYLYRCPQSIYIPLFRGGSITEEGFNLLDGDNLQDRLLDFLNSAGPLRSCDQCAGSSGKQIEQTLLERSAWSENLAPLAEIINFDLLRRNIEEVNPRDDCRIFVKEKRLSKTYLLRKLTGLYRRMLK